MISFELKKVRKRKVSNSFFNSCIDKKNFTTNTNVNDKINEVKNKILNITNLATTAAVNAQVVNASFSKFAINVTHSSVMYRLGPSIWTVIFSGLFLVTLFT